MLLARRIEGWLWDRGPRGGALERGLLQLLRFIYAVLRDLARGPLTLHAMGLVYVTILSIVPLLAVSLSVLKAFGFERQLEPMLYRLLGPLGEGGADLTTRVMGFVDNAQGGLLAGLGLLFLFFTAISMAEQVEGTINQVWRVSRPRSIGRRISEYLAVILVGPVLMVTAMTLIARLTRSALAQGIAGVAAPGLGDPATVLAPYVLVCAGFSFVNWFVPNTRVRASAALVGGIVGGVLWAGTGAAFAAFVANAVTTASIYASFAVAVTALLWLYLCWLILLVSTQVAFYAQNPDYLRVGYRQLVTGTGQHEQAALAIMLLVAQAFRDGRGALAPADITQTTGLPGLALAPVVARLESSGLLARTDDERLLPKRDLERIRVRDIVGAVRHPEGSDVGPDVRWPAGLASVNERLEIALDAALGEDTLADLVGPAR